MSDLSPAPTPTNEQQDARETVHLTQREFDDLLDYSCSLPTGTTVGKRWKRRNDYYDASKGWVMGEYAEHPNPDLVNIVWRDIVIDDALLAAVSAAAPASPTTPTPTVSEWGARHEGFVREFGEDEDAARRWVALGSRRWTVVRREVTAWTVADAPAAEPAPVYEVSPGAFMTVEEAHAKGPFSAEWAAVIADDARTERGLVAPVADDVCCGWCGAKPTHAPEDCPVARDHQSQQIADAQTAADDEGARA